MSKSASKVLLFSSQHCCSVCLVLTIRNSTYNRIHLHFRVFTFSLSVQSICIVRNANGTTIAIISEKINVNVALIKVCFLNHVFVQQYLMTRKLEVSSQSRRWLRTWLKRNIPKLHLWDSTYILTSAKILLSLIEAELDEPIAEVNVTSIKMVWMSH